MLYYKATSLALMMVICDFVDFGFHKFVGHKYLHSGQSLSISFLEFSSTYELLANVCDRRSCGQFQRR